MTQRSPTPAQIQAAARALVASATIEIPGRELNQVGAATIAAWRGRQAFLPWTPNLDAEDMIRATAAAHRLGLAPVPHVAARRIASEPLARALFAGLARAGAEAALLIGGDVREARGPYRSSLELLRSGAAQAAGIRRLGIAGYPEGHPAIADDLLRESLERKLEYMRSEGLDAFIVSQFCFDAQTIVGWMRELRSAGIVAPFRVGVAGPTNLAKLLQLALRCGVGNSIRALKGRMGSMIRLVAVHEPEDLIRDIAAGALASPGVEPLGLHLFAFGGLEPTSRWIAREQGNAAARTAQEST